MSSVSVLTSVLLVVALRVGVDGGAAAIEDDDDAAVLHVPAGEITLRTLWVEA